MLASAPLLREKDFLLPVWAVFGGICYILFSFPHIFKFSQKPPVRIGPAKIATSNTISQLYLSHDRWANLQYLEYLNSEGLAPLTKETQNWIWEKQSREQHLCSSTKYFLVHHSAGLGSMIHVAAFYLGYALENDLVLLWHPNTTGVFIEQGCGRDLPYSNMDCLFEPLSTCTTNDVRLNNVETNAHWELSTVNKEFEARYPRDRIPTVLRQQLEDFYRPRGVNLTKDFLKYWWRGQAAAYIARPNRYIRKKIAEMRMQTSIFLPSNPVLPPIEVPFPFPRGTINIHVRHGDKGKEMDLIPTDLYFDKIEQMIASNPLFFKKNGFVSSEDPQVFEFARNLTHLRNETAPDTDWVLFQLNIARPNENLPWPVQLHMFGRDIVVSWLLELFLALECDAWVGTRGSNWDRLIDELRCVWVDKCPQPFTEVGGHEGNWKTYGW